MVQAPETHLLDSREQFLHYIHSKVSDADLAEDILQDSLLKALRASRDLRDEERMVPWFYQIIRNAIVDAYRSKGREHSHVLPIEDMDFPMAEEDVTALCQCFQAILPTLKPE